MPALAQSRFFTRRRLLLWGLLLLLGLLQYRLWWGHGGMVQLDHGQEVLAKATAQNEAMKKRNTAIAADVADLAKGGVAIEARARRQLGMIHKGETFYLVVHPSN
ncbi:MAG: septum formation initiator family protein [Sinobacteraceae bacterium]|nr:septum formation initiator family protein [Nevskiaceae bacterium]